MEMENLCKDYEMLLVDVGSLFLFSPSSLVFFIQFLFPVLLPACLPV